MESPLSPSIASSPLSSPLSPSILPDNLVNNVREFAQPYKQPMDKMTVFIWTAIFAIFYTVLFAVSDKTDVDYYGNIINLFNSAICFLSGIGYLATKEVGWCVAFMASFVGSSLAEIVLGTVFYYERMFLSTYVHHILYSVFMYAGLFLVRDNNPIYILGSFIELSAFFQSIKRMWHVQSLPFDFFNAIVFFVTRILLWIPMVGVYYCVGWEEQIGEKIFVLFTGATIFLHFYWSGSQWRNIFRKLSMNGTTTSNPADAVNELYLTSET
jgi:hypothetical protein